MVTVLTTVPNEKSVAEVNQEPISKVSIQIIIQAESIFFPLSQEQVNLFLIVIPQDDSNEINFTLPENHTVELIVSHRRHQNQKVVGNYCADGRVTLLTLTHGRPSNIRKTNSQRW